MEERIVRIRSDGICCFKVCKTRNCVRHRDTYQVTNGVPMAEGENFTCVISIEDAAIDAWLLMEYVTGMTRTRFFVDGMIQMNLEEEERYFQLIEKRSKRIPLQHLTGVQEFMGLEFLVNEHVLVPRQDTELLVLEAERQLRKSGDVDADVLDMCTGSGCIAVSLKVRNPEIHCTAADVSEAALEMAKKNAAKLQSEITFVHTDMFSEISGKFDMIISNPPYIPTEVIEGLEAEVRLHDPFAALDGKEDGLYFYRILAREGPRYLKKGGWIYMEIGHDQSEAVEMLLKEAGFEQIRTEKDLAGLDRVVCGVYNISRKI